MLSCQTSTSRFLGRRKRMLSPALCISSGRRHSQSCTRYDSSANGPWESSHRARDSLTTWNRPTPSTRNAAHAGRWSTDGRVPSISLDLRHFCRGQAELTESRRERHAGDPCWLLRIVSAEAVLCRGLAISTSEDLAGDACRRIALSEILQMVAGRHLQGHRSSRILVMSGRCASGADRESAAAIVDVDALDSRFRHAPWGDCTGVDWILYSR